MTFLKVSLHKHGRKAHIFYQVKIFILLVASDKNSQVGKV